MGKIMKRHEWIFWILEWHNKIKLKLSNKGLNTWGKNWPEIATYNEMIRRHYICFQKLP